MSLFRLDAGIRVEGSHSRAIAGIVEQEWAAAVEPISASLRRLRRTDYPAGKSRRLR